MRSRMPWWKFWAADFEADTRHLESAELGNHIRLLCFAWRRPGCSIPNDPDWIKRRLGVDDEQYERDVLPVIREFWTEEGDDLVNDGLRDEYLDAVERSESSRKAAMIRHHGPNVHALKQKGNL